LFFIKVKFTLRLRVKDRNNT